MQGVGLVFLGEGRGRGYGGKRLKPSADIGLRVLPAKTNALHKPQPICSVKSNPRMRRYCFKMALKKEAGVAYTAPGGEGKKIP